MGLHIFKGTAGNKCYVSYLVVDDSLRLLTPLFTNDFGLGTFKERIADERGLKDENVPSDVSEHVRYHTDIEDRILELFGEDLRGKTINGKHGHFPLPHKQEEFAEQIVGGLLVNRVIAKQDAQALATLPSWG
jgi:hypothetical protein